MQNAILVATSRHCKRTVASLDQAEIFNFYLSRISHVVRMQRAAKVGLLVGATGAATYRLQGRASSEHDITKVGARSKSSSSFDVVPREAAAVLRPRFMRLLSEQEYSKLESRRLFLERRIAEDGLSEMAWTVVATVIAVPATILASTAGLKRGKWMIFALIMTAGTFADFIVT